MNFVIIIWIFMLIFWIMIVQRQSTKFRDGTKYKPRNPQQTIKKSQPSHFETQSKKKRNHRKDFKDSGLLGDDEYDVNDL